ncbi:MAG: hypothetical protein Q8L65_08755, partial [Burkholderiales bacterium]|nr:hypothetical protein [Burkholderiales bacterium]
MNNEGTVNLRGELSLWGGTEFNNKGVLRAMAGGPNYVGMDGSTFNNSGVVEAVGDLSVIDGGSSFFTNVGGTLASAPGLLEIRSGGSHSGVMNITGSQVLFTGGTRTFANGSTVNGQLNVHNTDIFPIQMGFGTTVLNGLLDVSGGGGLNAVVGGGSTLTLNGGMSAPAGPVNFSGGGTIELPVGQTMALTGVTSYTLDGVTLNNEGTVNLRGELSLWGGTEFNNKGLLRAMAGGSNYVGMDGSTLNNSGVLEAIGDLSIINTSSSLFTNVGGTLASAPGYLDIWAQSSHSGAINITGSQVRFLGETHAFAAGSTVNGQLNLMGGTLSPGSSPGTLVINGDYTQGPDAT